MVPDEGVCLGELSACPMWSSPVTFGGGTAITNVAARIVRSAAYEPSASGLLPARLDPRGWYSVSIGEESKAAVAALAG